MSALCCQVVTAALLEMQCNAMLVLADEQVGGGPGADGDVHGGEHHGRLGKDPPHLLPRHSLPPLHEPLLIQVTG